MLIVARGYARAAMAADDQNTDQPAVCAPCRGTGQVASNLGGTRSTVTCPWCDGTGRFQPGHDAQARWRSAAETDT